jgi:radical SAM protein with 4Fe4S-binding SPASM domain
MGHTVSGRYAKLKKDWLLRSWTDMPIAIVNWKNGDVRKLTKKQFYVAESCDGMTNFDSCAFLPEHNALLDALIKEGIAEECRGIGSIESFQRYRKANNPRLIGIQWCLTGFCNLNCRHCYMESPSGQYSELPFEVMVQLVDQFVQANVIQVSLTGGEPFLRNDIMDIIGLLSKKKLWLNQIYSNGLLVTEEHLKGLKRIGFSPKFYISFDGVGAHDQMRGTNGIETDVIESIRRISMAGFSVGVSTCVDQMNIDRLDDTYDLIKELGVKTWRVSRPHRAGNWRKNTTAISLVEMAEACARLLKRWQEDGKPFDIGLANFYNSSEGGRPYTPDSYNCNLCHNRPNLLPDGTLVPCPGYVDSALQEKMPNILHKTLSEVWTDSFLRQIADMKKKDVLAKNPECAVCELFKDCGSGCRVLALIEKDDLMAKDPDACEIWKGGYNKRFKEIAVANP